VVLRQPVIGAERFTTIVASEGETFFLQFTKVAFHEKSVSPSGDQLPILGRMKKRFRSGKSATPFRAKKLNRRNST
jgi:hypothetical protein